MKKLFIILLTTVAFAIFSCGSTKKTEDRSTSKSTTSKIELPPNVASNKYSKKRHRH
ncbi:hypothetical protein Q4Q34_14155 [Flavivirga abyssicola]|uniref:hypothetical protein n=1 Tax=Flavivirga abyssicola TaxID=3063533 RepID=UPI0026DEC08D|nr:hypothetical protein [Flavivirga sp. MEBiC07777]WVK12365.1 hypothetical protein Q4Q34_14155 [Flavivirga sp. MEBiC07777]